MKELQQLKIIIVDDFHIFFIVNYLVANISNMLEIYNKQTKMCNTYLKHPQVNRYLSIKFHINLTIK